MKSMKSYYMENPIKTRAAYCTGEGVVCERIRLFEDVDYDANSLEDLDTCCYYNEYTQIDFSASGRYMAARVRGDFDPQESDGRTIMFEPVFFRSVFVFDMKTRKLIFEL